MFNPPSDMGAFLSNITVFKHKDNPLGKAKKGDE